MFFIGTRNLGKSRFIIVSGEEKLLLKELSEVKEELRELEEKVDLGNKAVE